MIAFTDLIFDTVKGFIVVLGWLLVLFGTGLFLYITRFTNRATAVIARVVSHSDQREEINATGSERNLYRAKFEVANGPHAGARYTSHEVQKRNVYPIGTQWPAKFEPKSGAIRTRRALLVWPGICATLVITGCAMIVIPNLPAIESDYALGIALIVLGIASCAFGVGERALRMRSGGRSLVVEAELIAIDIAYDTERHEYKVPVLRILSGDFEGAECTDVSINDVEESDIGAIIAADFDAYSGKLIVSTGHFAARPNSKPLLLLGAVFTGLGAIMNSNLL